MNSSSSAKGIMSRALLCLLVAVSVVLKVASASPLDLDLQAVLKAHEEFQKSVEVKPKLEDSDAKLTVVRIKNAECAMVQKLAVLDCEVLNGNNLRMKLLCSICFTA
jgi:hypothetical protein